VAGTSRDLVLEELGSFFWKNAPFEIVFCKSHGSGERAVMAVCVFALDQRVDQRPARDLCRVTGRGPVQGQPTTDQPLEMQEKMTELGGLSRGAPV
jgi:hypothetical protein